MLSHERRFLVFTAYRLSKKQAKGMPKFTALSADYGKPYTTQNHYQWWINYSSQVSVTSWVRERKNFFFHFRNLLSVARLYVLTINWKFSPHAGCKTTHDWVLYWYVQKNLFRKIREVWFQSRQLESEIISFIRMWREAMYAQPNRILIFFCSFATSHVTSFQFYKTIFVWKKLPVDLLNYFRE